MKLLHPSNWTDYELIDSGEFEKLERFGNYILTRPEPQAVWSKSLSSGEWEKLSHAFFRKEKNDPEKGKWFLKKGMPEQWFIEYRYKEMRLKMRLGLTGFKHVGVFPEQSENWDYIYDQIKSHYQINASGKTQNTEQGDKIEKDRPAQVEKQRILNLFAYTGGASLAAIAAGADVIHVDSVKPVLTWARENMEASGMSGIRWMFEDALKFVQREVRRGNTYHGIILDPPAYGRGPDGEKWVLEDSINEMMRLCSQLLMPEKSFLILNLYSIGFSALIAENLVKSHFGTSGNLEIGELYIPDKYAKKLPLGVFARLDRCGK
ncbi:MAG: class I SAM-dependent methyltransferase [Bacteroidota bacterium]|nr:class I SAM-dependent methyltransferase [Bacteroidota bacterium]